MYKDNTADLAKIKQLERKMLEQIENNFVRRIKAFNPKLELYKITLKYDAEIKVFEINKDGKPIHTVDMGLASLDTWAIFEQQAWATLIEELLSVMDEIRPKDVELDFNFDEIPF